MGSTTLGKIASNNFIKKTLLSQSKAGFFVFSNSNLMNTQKVKKETIPKKMSDWETLKHFPVAVYVLVIGSFVNRLGTFVLPYMALYLMHKGYSLAQAGNALAGWGLGNLVATIVGGHLADTLGRRNTIVISMLGCAIMVVCLSQVESLYGFVVFAFLTALFSEIYRPASHALIADLVKEEDRILVYAILRWAINVGFAFGPALAGFLTQISYTWVFLLDAMTSAVFGILALFFLPRIEKHANVPMSHVFKAFSSLKKSFSTCFTDNRFVQVFLSSFLIAFAFLQTFATLGIEVQNRSYSEVQYGLILGLNGLMIVFFELPVSVWIRRQPQRYMMSLGYALIGIGFGVFAMGDALASLYTGMVIMTVGEMIAMPVSLAYVSSMAPDDMRGRYMGVWGFSWALAMVLATSGGLKLYALLGSPFWLVVAFLALIGSALMMIRPKA